MEKVYKYIIGIVILVLIAINIWSYLENKSLEDQLEKKSYEVTTLTSSVKEYKLANGQLVNTVASLELSKSNLKELVIAKDKNLVLLDKKVKILSVTNVSQTANTGPIAVTYPHKVEDTINKSNDSICDFEVMDTYNDSINKITFNYVATNKSFKIPDGINVDNTLTISENIETRGFWKFLGGGTETRKVDVINSNKLFRTNDIKDYRLKDVKSNLPKYLIVGGVIVGILIGSSLH